MFGNKIPVYLLSGQVVKLGVISGQGVIFDPQQMLGTYVGATVGVDIWALRAPKWMYLRGLSESTLDAS